jgi:hypothetical protein
MRLALVAAGAAWMAGPATASIVTARSQVELPIVLEVSQTSDGAVLDPDSAVAVEIGGIDINVTRNTPGISADSATGTAQITNLLGVEIEVVFDEWFFTLAELTLDNPGERESASASAIWQIFVGDTLFDGSAVSVEEEGCTDFPCNEISIDPGTWTQSIIIAPNDMVRFDVEGSVRAEFSIIPLPGPAGLMLFGIGALGWVSRRWALRRPPL